MPTEEENIQYLYLILTSAGTPQINWVPISTALSLNVGATSKRWSRLRTALESGKPAGKGAYELLWLCVQHSTRAKAPDWKDIAARCGTTAGAASKRYSRMKLAWEKDAVAAPTTAVATSSSTSTSSTLASAPAHAPATPKKTAAKLMPTTPASKRRRGPVASPDDKYNPEATSSSDADEPVVSARKRARRPRKNPASPTVKPDPDALPSPTPTPTRPQHRGFQGFASGEEKPEFRGFRGEGESGEGDGGEEWHESREFPDGDGNEWVSGWLEEI